LSGSDEDEGGDPGWQRLDKWLWCARFLKARADCARLAAAGLVRINRQPTDKPHARVRIGDVLTVPLRQDVIVIRVMALAARRGPAAEARLLYTPVEAQPEVQAQPETVPCAAMESSAYAPRGSGS